MRARCIGMLVATHINIMGVYTENAVKSESIFAEEIRWLLLRHFAAPSDALDRGRARVEGKRGGRRHSDGGSRRGSTGREGGWEGLCA